MIVESRGKSIENFKVLIYDQYFFDSFYLYRKEFFKTIILIFINSLVLFMSAYLYLTFIFRK